MTTVVTGTGRVARELTEGLGAHPLACDFTSEDEVASALEGATRDLGGIDQLVHAWLPDALLERADLSTVDEATWAAACEGAMEGAWWLGRHARAHLQPSRGSLVFVVPAVGLAGAAGFAMLAAVAEGLRVLAKGCGRQWGSVGVTVNTVAVAPHAYLDHDVADGLQRAVSLSKAAMGGPGSVRDDIAPLIRLLGSADAHFLTASTAVADGGLWMGL
jgi:3-oxoacyl-[acyl-carrier protein] reductase